MSADHTQDHGRPLARCPICKANPEPAFRPFCSRRCADVDLSRWLRGCYAIASRTDDDDDDGGKAANAGVGDDAEPSTTPDGVRNKRTR